MFRTVTMGMLLCAPFTNALAAEKAQYRLSITEDITVYVINEEPVGQQSRVFQSGDTCTLVKDRDQIDVIETKTHSVRIIAYGSRFSEGDACPAEVDAALTLDQYEKLKKAQEAFTETLVK